MIEKTIIYLVSNNPNYKDGRTPLVRLLRQNVNYKQWRITCFKRDNYTCQECGQVGGILNVDHIKPFSIILKEFLKTYSQFSPIEDKETLMRLSDSYAPFFDIDNGRTLCFGCHKKTKTYGGKK